MNNIHRLHELGQSVWLDTIDRGLLDSGELKRMIIEDGIGGLTSNPSIFAKAMADTHYYDASLIDQLARNPQQSPRDLFYALAIEDIQIAADMLRPVYESSGGSDGFASLEVSPELADDAQATIKEAHELWQCVKRPNLMIKVPATVAGVTAVQQLIADGLNVNATLLFSVTRYIDIAEAYLAGLEQRLAQGKDIHRIASVASFFISRIDTEVDRLLTEKINQATDKTKTILRSLLGKCAIANGRLAYQHWRRLFGNERFERLAQQGGRSQRLLWASTGVKNPDYSDVHYVTGLIGRDTVNTLPLDTLRALLSQADIGQPFELTDTAHVLQHLDEAGIELDDITGKLERQGIMTFSAAFTSLVNALAEKSARIMSERRAND